jgi:TRAP-type uncharacterized transport system fused permease subunit
MRLGIVAYLVPFVFVFHPALILVSPPGEIALTVITAGLGVILLGIGCAGYLFRPLGWGRRTWAIVAGLCLFAPPIPGLTSAMLDVAGLGLGTLLVVLERGGFTSANPRSRLGPLLRYFKDKGAWSATMDAAQQKVLNP